MFNLKDNMHKLQEGIGLVVAENGRLDDSFRNSLLKDGLFHNTSREAIEFSKEMETARESILTVGMTEMNRLRDAGKELPEATAGALSAMTPKIEELKTTLRNLGFDGEVLNGILKQLGLDPTKLTGALTIDTTKAEENATRVALKLAAIQNGNWEVALSASAQPVQNTLLKVKEYQDAYNSGGWKAVATLVDKTGPGMGELMVKLEAAKSQSEIEAVIKAEFPGAKIIDSASEKLRTLEMIPDPDWQLQLDDKLTPALTEAEKKLKEVDDISDVTASIRAEDLTGAAVESAKASLESPKDVTRRIIAENMAKPASEQAQITMESVKDVWRNLYGRDMTEAETQEAQNTMNSLKDVYRNLLGVDVTEGARASAQRNMDSFKGKMAELSAKDNASSVIQAVENKRINDKTFSVRGLLEGLPEPIRRLIGFADGGIIKMGVQTFANGGVQMPQVKSFAKGGSENHVAQIARGAWPVRIWAEPETGGEAYVPLHPSKRKRSLAILEEVAEMFGYSLFKKFADGGIMDIKATRPSMISNSSSVTQLITNTPSGANAPTVITNVYPSAGLDEVQVADSVSENIYWKLQTRL
jgi:hypothetical protein